MADFLYYPFLACGFTTTETLRLTWTEQGYSQQYVEISSDTEFETALSFLEYLADKMTDASNAGNYYSIYLDSEQAAVCFGRAGGSADYSLDWNANAATEALADILGYNHEAATATLAAFCGDFHPRYFWCPKTGFAGGGDIGRESLIVATRDYDGGVAITTTPDALDTFSCNFQPLLKRQVYIDPVDKYAAFATFWSDAKAGRNIFIFDHREYEEVDGEIDIESYSSTTMEVSEADSYEDYRTLLNCVVTTGCSKGAHRRVYSSERVDSDTGEYTISAYKTNIAPLSGSISGKVKLYNPYRLGYFAESMSNLPVSRLGTQAAFYAVSVEILVVSSFPSIS